MAHGGDMARWVHRAIFAGPKALRTCAQRLQARKRPGRGCWAILPRGWPLLRPKTSDSKL
eukprot:9154341-Pyramimonas_sp.AAC.1